MFDSLLESVNGVVGLTVGGISVATIISMVIVVIKEVHRAHKAEKVTKESIEQAFQNAVLPTKIKIDLSNKIQGPLEEGLLQIKTYINDTLEHVQKGQKLILSILSQFSHVNKLPVEMQNEIQEYLDESKTVEVKLE